jgi:hypothetical protein
MTRVTSTTGKPSLQNLLILQSGQAGVTISSNPTNICTVPHNLGFVPVPLAFLNNVSLNYGNGQSILNTNIPLPASLGTSAGGTLTGVVTNSIYMFCLADSKNFYVITLNATGAAISGVFEVTYELLQQTANL